MKHVVHALHRPFGDRHVGKVALEKFHAGNMREILSLAGNQAVGDANAVAAADQLLSEVGADESGAAGDEVSRHSEKDRSKP